MVNAGLQTPCLVARTGEERHAVAENPIHDGLREVFAHEDAHSLTIVVLGIADDGCQHLLAEQDDADDGEDVGCLAPLETFRHDEGVDGIDGAVEHDGVHLCDE